MSGHSKWAKIKRAKGSADAARGKVFSRLIREITIAARMGGGDKDSNPRLRSAIAAGRAANMPSKNVEGAIAKGTGTLDGVLYEEFCMEGYAPGGVAVLVDCMSDNRNRTVAEVRHAMTKGGGNMAAANAQIGVAYAAYYPALTLSATGGMESSAIKNLLDWPSRFWSVGPSVSETVYDGGLRRATVNQYIATYNADLAAYRQSVLIAFQQVEDSLAAVRILSQQVRHQQEAVDSSQMFLKLELGRYETGIDPYIDVIIAQTTLLSNQQALTNLQVLEMTASVQLIESLGGGWDRSQLPSPAQVTRKPSKSETSIQH